MLLRAFVLALIGMVSLPAAAEVVDGNRGVACKSQADASTLMVMSQHGEHARWADKVLDLKVKGACITLMAGSYVKVISGGGQAGLVNIAAGAGGAESYWMEAASVKAEPVNLSLGKPRSQDALVAGVLGLCAAVFVVVLLARWAGRRQAASQMAYVGVPSGAEIWEERRAPRSGFGKLVKWSFILFNLWMLAEVVLLSAHVDRVRGQYRDNGFAQLGISAASNVRMNELFVIWAIGAVILGAGTVATRGAKRLVRRVS
jgi:hypothetical protein